MQEPTGYEPSKVELLFAFLERGANGLADALHIPSYLAWAGIILILIWVVFFAVLLVESVVRYIRYALIILSTMWAIGFMLALQYYASTG